MVFIDPSEGGPYIEHAGLTARINDDGTITALSGTEDYHKSVFAEFDGYTSEQVAEMMQEYASRAKAWLERHSS